jgi:hypothetical protein
MISATVGLVLRFIAERFGFIGRLIEAGAGLAWTVATFLVVPVLAAEGVGPFDAIARSAQLLNKTWGENLIGNGGISIVTSLIGAVIALLGFGSCYLLFERGFVTIGIWFFVFSGFLMIALMLVSTALSAIYAATVYYFAVMGEPPEGFDKHLIRDAFSRKPSPA